jgi:hypothetical protein
MATQVKQITADQEIRDLLEIEGSSGTNNVRSEHSRFFIVWNDDGTTMLADDARQASGVPQLGDAMDGNVLFLANNVRTAARGGGGFAWVVEIGYTGVPFNPLAVENVTENWTSQNTEEAIDQGFDDAGNAVKITNKADENFDPAVTREFADLVMTRSKNILVFNTAVWYPYLNKVSNAPYRGFPVPTALCRSISSEQRVAGVNFYYWRITYQVHFRTRMRTLVEGQPPTEHGWKRVIANMGYREFQGNQGSTRLYHSLLDKDGMPVTSPLPLHTDGRMLQAGEPFNWLAFNLHERINLNNLDLL